MPAKDVKTRPPASDAEQKRAAAEALRESAERARAEAEALRRAAEEARAAAEATRVTSVAEVSATAEGLTAILDEMKAVESMRRARRSMKDPDDPKTH
jgi:regulator of protease activity HflC (stomatin/prohibitin superfamily)